MDTVYRFCHWCARRAALCWPHAATRVARAGGALPAYRRRTRIPRSAGKAPLCGWRATRMAAPDPHTAPGVHRGRPRGCHWGRERAGALATPHVPRAGAPGAAQVPDAGAGCRSISRQEPPVSGVSVARV